jgi:23S rRNA pseudouridine2457 synthase
MSKIILFNKPYQVLCQFTPVEGKKTLADYIDVPGVYAAGRLDFESEGLLVLTDDGKLQAQIAEPKHKQPKCYLAQVENVPQRKALVTLGRGVKLKDGVTRPARVRMVDEPGWLWPRQPPIRQRRDIPTQWLELEISEGKNRQVRRMTAAVGHPTLRLIRTNVANWTLADLQPGNWREETV